MELGDRVRHASRRIEGNSFARRGLLGTGALLAAAAIARLEALPARAADLGNFILGQTNTATSTTTLSRTSGSNAPALSITNTDGIGIQSNSSNSVGSYSTSTGGIGVQGVSDSSLGVLGFSTNGVGVQGQSNSNIGVFGLSNGGTGLVGFSSTSVGLQGQSVSGVGLFGSSDSNVGLFGQSNSGLAGQFQGGVFITGPLTVQGTKSATVPHPDGSHRRLYCMESPESYFEDFGRDRLVKGVAKVQLDADFAAVVHNDNYHVFLQPTSDCNGLFISSQNPTGFEVRELHGGTHAVSFSYRVVAKRKDIEGPRLERVTLPAHPVGLDPLEVIRKTRSNSLTP